MRTRATSENANAVGLFPFLAVLLCTMGALLVLLVVLAQRAGKRVAEVDVKPADTGEVSSIAVEETQQEADALAKKLEEVRQYQERLRELRRQAETRLRKEQLRLSHLEEHTRRLEHELARLSLAAQQLEATEQNQTVDQEQAAQELARLQDLIQDTEQQLEQLREQAAGKRSYAVVPYKGPNGTYRRPVYIECCREGIIIHPEGITLGKSDFALTSWPGNPLAAMLRATREYLNAQAAKAGEPEPPDPYPLLLVRPDGLVQYGLARQAITAWDSDFGYEFIDGDWHLDFPVSPDPQLARVQQHAMINAREQMARLARAAPRRFRGVGYGGSSSSAAGGDASASGYGMGDSEAPNDGTTLGQLANGDSVTGNGVAAGQMSENSEQASGQFQLGALGAGSGDEGQTDATGAPVGSQGNESTIATTDANESSLGQSGADGGTNSFAQSGNPGSTGAASDGSSDSGASGGAAAARTPSSSGSPPTATSAIPSIADSRGANWAVERHARGSVAIRRPIQVVVRKDRLSLLPSRHASGGAEATGTVISLNQSVGQVSDEFVEALRTRVEEWGLAGNGLYWRPVLELHIGPDTQETASYVTRLLKNSGVEVRLPETAQVTGSIPSQSGDRVDATR